MNVWFSTSTPYKRNFIFVVFAFGVFACGNGPYQLDNDTDRAALKFEIKQALTTKDCAKAISLVTPLYQSKYSDNEARMYYASAHACNMGIQLYTLIDNLSSANMSNQSEVIKSLVRLFPSTSSDSRLASSWYAMDALQTILNPGAVTGSSDQIKPGTDNVGSDLATDRTLDANTYLVFVGMGVVGIGLNRFGYAANQTAVSLAYAQGQNLPWIDRASVLADADGTACAITAGLYNMFDGIHAIITQLSGGPTSALSNILTNLQTAVDLAGAANCTINDHYSVAQCSAAAIRIRYRGACAEQAAAASFAAGVIQGLNLGWQ